jgi:hypothetical protein
MSSKHGMRFIGIAAAYKRDLYRNLGTGFWEAENYSH